MGGQRQTDHEDELEQARKENLTFLRNAEGARAEQPASAFESFRLSYSPIRSPLGEILAFLWIGSWQTFFAIALIVGVGYSLSGRAPAEREPEPEPEPEENSDVSPAPGSSSPAKASP